ncbi:MAG TPA: hypothetical protein VIX17_11410 [Pyrinomonadaceae bacterium]|jgi:hypothetical protein
MTVLRKDPNETKTFGVNWAPYLGDSLTIASSSWILPPGVTEVSSGHTDTLTTIKVSGGVEDVEDDIEPVNIVTLSPSGDVLRKVAVIQIREASWELTEDELLVLAEIAIEDISDVQEIAEDLTINQVTYLRAEMATWNENRNEIDLELQAGTGGGVDLNTSRLLEAIRSRVRKQLGLPLYSSEVMGGSYSVDVRGVF